MNRLFISCTSVATLALAGAAFAGGNPACPNPSHDCASTGTPGCSDTDCCNLICDADSFCCATAWDSICVNAALVSCTFGPVCNECCPADLNFDGVVDGADLGLLLAAWGTNDPCADLSGDGTVDGADLGLLLAAFGPCPSEISCDCAEADHDCCTTGGPGCTDLKCCEIVCTADPFCCETSWDTVCVGEANDLCAPCPGNPACDASDHDCCTTGIAGCTDIECCNAVCLADPFCCATSWDSVCVGEAVTICGLSCALCPASDHDCFTTGGPGCSDVECCDLVCAADLFCCQTAWDGICVSEAFTFCGTPKCPFECTGTPEPELCGEDTDGGCNVPIIGDSNCCVANGGLGCDDPTCSDAVCAVDSFCCAVAWDGICASEALTICPDLCQVGKPGFAPISCGETICGTAWADGSFRDTDWYEIDLLTGVSNGTQISFSGTTTLPLVLGIVDTNGVPDCALATALNPFVALPFCGSGGFEACLPPGIYWFFAAPNAFSGFPCGTTNDYSITLECLGECFPPSCGDAGHDCLTEGGPFCDDEVCCQTVCASDPFCCDTAWDATCVAEASLLCFGQCPPSDHDCFTSGGVGCTDNECCLTVCGVDLFCCQVAWDGICVSEAFALCTPPTCDFACTPGSTPEPEDCGADTNGGCNPPNDPFNPALTPVSCGETVCGTAWAAGGTRDTDWYRLTGGAAGVTTMTVSAQLPMIIGPINSIDCATASQINPFATTTFCGTASVEFCYDGVEAWLFAGPNTFDGFPCGANNGYEFTIACTGAECVAPNTCCFASGGLGCEDDVCTACVCGADPFCCDTAWDGLCAGAALPGGVCAGSCPCGG